MNETFIINYVIPVINLEWRLVAMFTNLSQIFVQNFFKFEFEYEFTGNNSYCSLLEFPAREVKKEN